VAVIVSVRNWVAALPFGV
jgi:hypothetical protein